MKIRIESRLSTMILDHVVSCIVLLPLFILGGILIGSRDSFEITPPEMVFFWLLIFLYYNKDFVNGRSISKRLTGFVVVDNKSGEPASALKCFVRNLTGPIWPLEVVISIINPKRRLGDYLAGTHLIKTSKAPIKSFFIEAKSIKPDQRVFWIVIIAFLYCLNLNLIFSNLIYLNRMS